MAVPSLATCVNHPEREALGVCVQCRTRVCSECSTKVEGINYCVTCLAGLAQAGRSTPHMQVRTGGMPWLSLALSAGLLWGLTWLLLEAVLPGTAAGPW